MRVRGGKKIRSIENVPSLLNQIMMSEGICGLVGTVRNESGNLMDGCAVTRKERNWFGMGMRGQRKG